MTGSSSDSSNSQLKCAKDIKINTSFLGGHHAGFNHNPTFLLVECISEFWSHEQSLQKAVEITGHSLVDQTDVTWRRAKERKSMQVHEKRHRSGLLRLTCIRFGENRRVRVGWTAVITTAAYGAFSGEGPDEALLRAVVQPAAFSSSRFILKAETGLLGTLCCLGNQGGALAKLTDASWGCSPSLSVRWRKFLLPPGSNPESERDISLRWSSGAWRETRCKKKSKHVEQRLLGRTEKPQSRSSDCTPNSQD